MKMMHVCLLDLRYDGRFTFVKSQESGGGAGFGEGDGNATGPRLNGGVRWVNHPRRRDDGTMLPEGSGIIATSDGATVLFTFSGRAVSMETERGTKGGQLLHVTFESADEQYAWLNAAVCVAEVVVDPGSLRLIFGVHEIRNEMLERLP